MGFWIDIIIVAIVVIFAIIGLWKGFLDSLLKFIGSLGALCLAIFGARPVLDFLDGIFHFREPLGNVCVNLLGGSFDQSLLDIVLNASTHQTVIDTLNADGLTLVERLMVSIVNGANLDAGLTVGQVLANSLGTILGCIIVGILIFVIVKFIVFLLAKLFDTKEKPALSGINRVLGMALGAIKGVVFVVVAYLVLSLSCMVFPIQPQVDEFANTTTLFKSTYTPFSESVHTFVNDKLGTFVEELTNNLIEGGN